MLEGVKRAMKSRRKRGRRTLSIKDKIRICRSEKGISLVFCHLCGEAYDNMINHLIKATSITACSY